LLSYTGDTLTIKFQLQLCLFIHSFICKCFRCEDHVTDPLFITPRGRSWYRAVCYRLTIPRPLLDRFGRRRPSAQSFSTNAVRRGQVSKSRRRPCMISATSCWYEKWKTAPSRSLSERRVGASSMHQLCRRSKHVTSAGTRK
jgi:hypothetical protein